MVRHMTIADYDKVRALWEKIQGFVIRSKDDSYEGIERFLKRNPTTSMVALMDDTIIGSILCGHDGRRGCFYHVCVDPEYRMHGIGKTMVAKALEELKKEGVTKVSLFAFCINEVGNTFWQELGWTQREDLNSYDYILDYDNELKPVG